MLSKVNTAGNVNPLIVLIMQNNAIVI